MAHRLIEVTSSKGHGDTIRAIAERFEVPLTQYESTEGALEVSHLLSGPEKRQDLIDALQTALQTDQNWRVAILTVDAVIPVPKVEEAAAKPATETREELYSDMVKGADGSENFILLAILSTIVAAIGLIQNNVAVVIGAMVIAPLLGPNLAFAFAVAMGDRDLMLRALRTSARGIAITLALTAVLGLLWPSTLDSKELLDRTVVGFDSLALALASGFAAALSLTTGLSTTLVGVMVAVALLPPAATLGIMTGSGQYGHAVGAATLLAANLASVILTAQVVFIFKGIGPRTWWEKKRARASLRLNLWVLSVLLLSLIALIEIESRL